MADTSTIGDKKVIMRVDHLKMYFPINTGLVIQRHVGDVKAVDDVSFEIYKGETLGLVGESGCGKTTLGRTVLRIYKPTEGKIILDGVDISGLKPRELQHMRKRAQMIFQDPYASLDPRMTVGSIIGEPFLVHGGVSGNEKRKRIMELMRLVELNPAFINRYPHEFSGGQRQRIGVARALALNPDLIVCDEPISALDVSIQAQVVNLLEDLQERLGLTYLFIAHDLSMVRHISDRVAVMYLGKIVELTDRDSLYLNPLHPYTKALLSAVPIPDPFLEEKREQIILEGDLPSPSNPPVGCNFNTRCPLAFEKCYQVEPDFIDVTHGHRVACHLVK